jgi:Glyoxalase-like domain
VPDEELQGAEGDFADRIQDPTGRGPRIWFQIVPERKTQKNRFHLDVYPTGRDRSLPLERRREIVEAKVSDLIAAGATIQRRFPDDFGDAPAEADHYFVVMHDPEGNEFCVA